VAVVDGFEVMRIKDAADIGDIFITVTGDKNVISLEHMYRMKDGAMIGNSGHFNVEIAIDELGKVATSKRTLRPFVDEYVIGHKTKRGSKGGTKKRIYILGEGRLLNLAAAEGHPAEVMDMSFANQALAAEFFVKNKGKLRVKMYGISRKMDQQIAKLKLVAMGIKFDKLTREQKHYLTSWQEGT
jgi:adenosylhomocysteinase